MNEAQMAIQVRLGHGTGTRAGENPALRVLFYRLCRLFTLPIIPIFVFDGPDWPKVKRGINVKTTKPHWLSTPLKKFIDAFSFFWYTVSISTCHLYLFLVILLFYRLRQKRKLTSLN
jgi:Holliday junction resolvase YEN1